jgi:hypothetical protein
VTASSPKGSYLTGRALESARAFDDVVVEESDPSDLVRLDDPRDLGCEKHVGFVVEVTDVHHHSTLFRPAGLNSSLVCMPELLGSSSGSSLWSPSGSETTMQSSSDEMSMVVTGASFAGNAIYLRTTNTF